MQTERGAALGGLVTYPDGTRGILATGGRFQYATEFLDLDTLKWEYKKALPVNVAYAGVVNYKEGLLLVGGHTDSHSPNALDTLYYYNPATDDWDLLSQSLDGGKWHLQAYLVPDSFITC